MRDALLPYSDGKWVLIHGDCPSGADAMAERIWVDEWDKPRERYPANWKLGRGAGLARNQQMVDLGADVCLAFRRGNSRGTTHCANAATLAGIETLWHLQDEDEE
jgi:hypothetical protein